MLAFALQQVKTKYRSGITQAPGYIYHTWLSLAKKTLDPGYLKLNSLDGCLCLCLHQILFPLGSSLMLAFVLALVIALVLALLVKTTQAKLFINTATKLQLQLREVTSIRSVPRCPTPLPAASCQITSYCSPTSEGSLRKVL